MKITDIVLSACRTASLLLATVLPEGEAEARKLWFRLDGCERPVKALGDPFVTAMLPFCMHEGESLTVEGPVSPTLMENLPQAQHVLAGWHDFLKPVVVNAAGMAPDEDRAEGVACCFSGGVDSWHALLTNAERTTHLLLVRGFDIGLDNDPVWSWTHRAAVETGRAMNKRVLTCETNLREIADKRRAGWGAPFRDDFWGKCLHGAAVAAVGHSLAGDIGALLVPSSFQRSDLKPWGSSPDLDHLWSSGRLAVGHGSCDANRLQKTRLVAQAPEALARLRVCYHDTEQPNCGRCMKCLRTMAALRLEGALDRAPTLPGHEALRGLMRLEPPRDPSDLEMLRAAAREAGDTQLERYLEVALGERFSLKRSLSSAIRRTRRVRIASRQAHAGPRSRTDGAFGNANVTVN